MTCNLVVTFQSEEKSLWCDYSNERREGAGGGGGREGGGGNFTNMLHHPQCSAFEYYLYSTVVIKG